ncbi:MAG: hypothetical protein ACI841_004589 [Planctomycetota bacterium]|jgi:hypothetical protein
MGDPALDLSVAISYLSPSACARFLANHGEIDDACWDRARSQALNYGAVLANSCDPLARAKCIQSQEPPHRDLIQQQGSQSHESRLR